MPAVDDLTIKVFADGADVAGILDLAANPLIKGFTTNPTLMRTAGITDYEAIHHHILMMADTLSAGIIAQFPSRFR